ncbi:cardiomyopathy-associated protein 5 [Thalassophryne amazonica]|uniref:cardiomyopathy-associated protein 5 n=1 Tax=Thalassophryne amazonica TaxID=390379 RepID=UPI001470CF30|nr:cardiomyopathy-associated protein 5 [Thalassophryne amazonica]
MDALAGFAKSDVDTEMTVLTQEDINEENADTSDEVETLQKSLREAVHDENVQPKMQCLMMDASFSMVTMQGEDSGIMWETTPGHCTSPWASEAGTYTTDPSCMAVVRPTTPGSLQPGRIVIEMDEQQITRRKKNKEMARGQKSNEDRQREILVGSSDNISARPELVGVSQPNVKADGEVDEELTDSVVDKEQQLFNLVSEGSEILNIVVPHKLATVDEEESKEMVDNLSYLEESPVTKANEDFDLNNELLILAQAPTESGASRGDKVPDLHPLGPNVMDPPGAPVARPLSKQAAGNVDYFEAFALIDAQAPGSPAVTAQGQDTLEAEEAGINLDTEKPMKAKRSTVTTVDPEKTDTISLGELISDLLDEVFYGDTKSDQMKSSPKRHDGCEVTTSKLPAKQSGSVLFGSQEDILTPIFLPEGPPKIIDPILLEEPKAMAFLYTDLYEEAIGSRKKEDDTESVTSEKSFHSRQSDREVRGYLEKYALIDETPALEIEVTEKEKFSEDGLRILSEDLYDFGEFLSKCEKVEIQHSDEDITDFFRSSGNSSPCDTEPFPQSLEEEATPPVMKNKTKTDKTISITEQKATEDREDPTSVSDFEFFFEEPDWSTVDHLTGMDGKGDSVHTGQELWKQHMEMQKPVAPPRRKATTSPKECLDLMPLTPVEVIMEEKEESGRKEQREEEKETASPAETADEGDGEEATQVHATLEASITVATVTPEREGVKDTNDTAVRDTKPGHDGDAETTERSETETPQKQSNQDDGDIEPSELAMLEVKTKKQVLETEPAKERRQCIIL